MVYPAIRLHNLYSLNLYEGLDIIFEDLSMLNIKVLEEVVKTKTLDSIQIVDNTLKINTNTNTIMIVGHKINESTYIVNRESKGDIIIMKYSCSNDYILTAIEYLYHMYKNLL